MRTRPPSGERLLPEGREIVMARTPSAVIVFVLASLIFPSLSYAQTAVATTAPAPAPEMSVAEIKDFLKNAKIIRTRSTTKGVTAPKRVTLSNGTIEHDAVFQAIDERKTVVQLGGGARAT